MYIQYINLLDKSWRAKNVQVFLDNQEHFRVFFIFKRSISKKYIFDIYFKTQISHATE
jgi:hypothetical protein